MRIALSLVLLRVRVCAGCMTKACTSSHTCANGQKCPNAYTLKTASDNMAHRSLSFKGKRKGVPEYTETFVGTPSCYKYKEKDESPAQA